MGAYVDKYKPIMGLDKWTIIIQGTKSEEGFAMCIDWAPNYHTATLLINFGIPSPEIDLGLICEEVVVHELTHLLLAPTFDLAEQEINIEGTLFAQFHRAFEQQTEDITAVITKLVKAAEKE